ncbi:MAG: family 16 glycosylhydrolase [candidate division KSB1 bacterium]|nr:family 16 glycosylhydrolase [candidate division KSB1 bacterium]MDZ7276266.1 family 16 glycosylhydrolase [candidate division KSB1 bacterium]MDZ7287928.1 family 16 glycosylhydrolase [candidate division KSB1 bacterium]MDZ7300059.1 family 16 glycosylhydrolase [candidate division KSB1 bacterium]MDZ7307301.1 family 16 glycosylhydrolase [candidate division KSB1 bacterium]
MKKTVGMLALLGAWSWATTLPAQIKTYRGAELRTRTPITYGRCEVRMKSAAGSGVISSFFTFHDGSSNPLANWNEIDIEIPGRHQNQVQFNTITPGQVNHVFTSMTAFNPHAAFHVYAIEWTPDYVAWFIDGYEVHRQTEAHIATLTRPQKIMMNLWPPAAVDWAGALNPAVLPVYAYYDWVKYYAYTPGQGDNFTLQWTDDFTAWDQNRWSKATHTWEGNNSNFIPDNVVFLNGYLILCLTTSTQTGYRGSPVIEEDREPPYLAWARGFDQRVHVYFSEELERGSAETLANYTLPGATLLAARLLPGNKSVELLTEGLDPALTYILVVNGVQDRSPAANRMSLQYTSMKVAPPLPLHINVGGEGQEGFLPDQVWQERLEYGAVGGSISTAPAGTPISGTAHPDVFLSGREGLTFYHVRLAPGNYQVTLLLAETLAQAPGQRVFEVWAEGRLVFDNLDPFALAGPNRALEMTLASLSVTDGRLDLYFKPVAGRTLLNGLMIAALPSAVTGASAPPTDFQLAAFPNPFNSATQIAYSLAAPGRIGITVIDVQGKVVQEVLREFRTAGTHTLRLAAMNWPAGIYFLRLQVEGRTVATRKLTHLK